jgi:hypothetical protein
MTSSTARRVVLFAYGSGSSRRSPRNRLVAGELQQVGLTTLLTDLLTVEEEELDAQTAERTLEVSGSNASSGLLTDSHELLACSLFHQDVFDHALEHAEQGLAVYVQRKRFRKS